MLNCKLQDIIDNKAFVNNIYIVVRCFIACFSTHYIVDYIDRLSRLGIFFFGSYYSYANVPVGGSIISPGYGDAKAWLQPGHCQVGTRQAVRGARSRRRGLTHHMFSN